MNFKTRLSYNNRISFVYRNGEVNQTPFTEVIFSGDDYILAKSDSDIFYSVLDLDGNLTKDDLKVIHRFQNGLLLTYKPFRKTYSSSDGFGYNINYNVFSIFNFSFLKSSTVAIIQADEIIEESNTEIFNAKCYKTVLCNFLNKPVYSFRDFIFSEILDNQYIITGNSLFANKVNIDKASNGFFDFDIYKSKKIWSVVNIFEQVSHTMETDIAGTTVTGLSFKDAEINLTNRLSIPKLPNKEDCMDFKIYTDLKNESVMYKTLKKKNKLHAMIKSVLSISIN